MAQRQPARPEQMRPEQRTEVNAGGVPNTAGAESFGIGNFFAGVADFFQVQGAGEAAGQVVPQAEEQTERYLPSLDFKKKLEGKSVLLTGASGAVGSAVAKKLLKCNLRKLVLLVRDKDNIDPKITQLHQQGLYDDILFIETMDMREPQRIEQKFQNVMLRAFGGVLDTVILCHGVIVEKGLITSTIPVFDHSMLVNVRSMMHMVSLCTPFLKVQKKSSITILTSTQGQTPDPKAPVMSINHAMVHQLIKCAALETAYHGVRVNGVAAGVIRSDARTNQEDMNAMHLTDEENKTYLNMAAQDVPLLGQLNAPKEIAETLLFLASDDASFCTGEIMTVDGGQSLTTDKYDDYCAGLKSVYQDQ